MPHPRSTIDLNDPRNISVFDEMPFWSAPFGIRLLEKVVPRQHMMALDIGFGTGFPLTELAMRLGDSGTVYGIDPWETAIRRVEYKLEKYGIRNVKIITGEAENIPLADGSLDLIVSNNGLNNVHDPVRVYSECHRVLKSGGQLLFTINLDTSMAEFYAVMRQVLQDKKMPEALEAVNKHIYEKRKPLQEVKSQLEKSGFIVRQVTEDSFAYRFADATSLFNHYFFRLAFIPAWLECVEEGRREEVFTEIENRMNATGEPVTLTVPFVVVDCGKRG